MRVLLCKIQCPSFICFCKPSPHIYAAGSLKLEDTHQVSSPTAVVDTDDHDDDDDDAHVVEDVDHVDGLLKDLREEDCAVEEKEEEKEEEEEEEEGDCSGKVLKSSLKKAVSDLSDGERRETKKVQWVDLMGKELAQIREFESSEDEDMRYDGDQSCVCVIL